MGGKSFFNSSQNTKLYLAQFSTTGNENKLALKQIRMRQVTQNAWY